MRQKKKFIQSCAILFLIFLVNISLSYAKEVHSLSYDCPEGCVSGKPYIIAINITNLGDDATLITYVRVKDIIGDTTLAEWGDQSGVVHADMITLQSKLTKRFEFESTIPPPNLKDKLVFDVCTVQLIPFEAWSELGKNFERCYPGSHSIQIIECNDNLDCNNLSYCTEDNKCKHLNCTDCQFIRNHKCVDYGCCSNEDCAGNEQCINHICSEITCKDSGVSNNMANSEDIRNTTNLSNSSVTETLNHTPAQSVSYSETSEPEYLVNHTCSKNPCRKDQFIKDFQCVHSGCKYDEYVLNLTRCEKLICNNDEYFLDHECAKLECEENEFVNKHSCDILSCKEDEVIQDHTCQKLDCSFYQEADDHSCVMYSPVVASFFMEFIAIGIIIFCSVALYPKIKSRTKEEEKKKEKEVKNKKIKE